MKKLFKISLSLCLALTFMVGCSDDDKYTPADPSQQMVKITKRETTLPASPSQARIEVEAEGPVTVTTTADGWLTPTVNGNVITFDATFNASLESRSATVTIKCGQKSSNVAIIQEGVIADLGGLTNIVSTNDDARTFEIPAKTNCDVAFNSDADWVNVEIEDGVLKISLAPNATGHVRRANLTYSAGPVHGEVPILQYDFAKDIAGDYQWIYSNNSSGANWYYYNCNVSKTTSGYNCHITINSTVAFDIPMTFDAENCKFTINSATNIGMYNENYAFSIVYGPRNSDNALYLTTSTAVSMSGTAIHYDDYEATYFEFEDNGSWNGFTASAIYVRTYATNPLSGSVISTPFGWWYPTLVKPDAVAEGGE